MSSRSGSHGRQGLHMQLPDPALAAESTPLLQPRDSSSRSSSRSSSSSSHDHGHGLGHGPGHGPGHGHGTGPDLGYEQLPWWRTPSVYWLVGPFFLYILAFGGTIVPKITIILNLVCRRYYADLAVLDPAIAAPTSVFLLADSNPQCLDPAVQRRVTSLMTAINLVIGLLSALTIPQIGRLSDRYGRTRFMAVGSIGGIIAEVVIIFVVKYSDTVDYRWLLLGAVFEGATGSFLTGSILGHSYASDCSPPSRRGVAIGYLHACVFTGLALGPLMAGYLIELTGDLLSIFYLAIGSHLVYVAVVALIVPESLSEKHQQAARERHAQEVADARAAAAAAAASSPLRPRWWWWNVSSLRMANPLAPLRALAPRGPGSSPALVRNLLALVAADGLLFATASSSWPVIMLYSKKAFGWGDLETSLLLSFIASVRAISLLGVLPAINYIWRVRPARKRAAAAAAAAGGSSSAGTVTPAAPAVEKNAGADQLDIWTIRLSIAFDVFGALGFLLSPTPHLFFVSAFMTSFAGLAPPTIQTALTKHVPASTVGQLLGALGLQNSLGRIAGPVMLNSMYYATVGFFPSAVFLLMAGLYGLALVASLLVRPGVYLLPEGADESTPHDGSDLPGGRDGMPDRGDGRDSRDSRVHEEDPLLEAETTM